MEEQAMWKMEQPDPEVFRRVWERVMEGREDSPIQVEQPQTAAPGEGSMPEKGETTERAKAGETADQIHTAEEEPAPSRAEKLEQLMKLAWEGVAAGQQLVRRTGGRNRGLMQLVADHRSALRRLGAAYFLETGKRCSTQTVRPMPSRNGPLDRALREQYLWEGAWEKACREAAEQWGEDPLCELCQELAQDAALHTRTIRRILEQM